MTSPATVRPLTATEVAEFANRYADNGTANEMIQGTRALYPDATGLGYDWSNEYDDEGGSYNTTNTAYVLFADDKYVRVDYDSVTDEAGEQVKAIPRDLGPEQLFDNLVFGINRALALTEAKAGGPGEINFDFAELEAEYLTGLPTLYVAVAQ